jgi:hypothetical protein
LTRHEEGYVCHSPRLAALPRLLLAVAVALSAALVLWAALEGEGLGAAASSGSGPAQGTIVRCEPAWITVPVGLVVSLDLYVQDVRDLYGADLRLSFDPAAVRVVDADQNAAGVQIQPLSGFLKPDFVVRKVADNISGTIWYAATQVNPTLPVTGSGSLARVTLLPQATGTYSMPFTHQELVRRTGAQITVMPHECWMTFTEDPVRHLYLPLILRY